MTAHMISEAVAILRAGGLVGMPTETVYGLAADASNPQALQKIFAAKQRPSDHPLIVHVANLAQISEWADHVSMAASLLAEHFWPGPMTLIFKKAPHIHDLVTGGQATVGLRIPSHPLALQLVELAQQLLRQFLKS
jgi:L-threonylcarbamoyladenylate synthase